MSYTHIHRAQSTGSCFVQEVESGEMGILLQSAGEAFGCLDENSAMPVHFHCLLGTNSQQQYLNFHNVSYFWNISGAPEPALMLTSFSAASLGNDSLSLGNQWHKCQWTEWLGNY